MRLKDKVAIVTGGGQGIGRAYALRFIQEGSHVVIADIQEEKAHCVARGARDSGGKGLAVRADVSEPTSVRSMVEQTVGRFGGVDVLVNDAAVFATIKQAQVF